ncbi:MAG: FtsX-like permease family protein [bacterium]
MIAAAAAAVVLSIGFSRHIRQQIIEGSVAVQTGSARICRGTSSASESVFPGMDDPDWQSLIDLRQGFLAELSRDPRVKVWYPRVSFEAMVVGAAPPVTMRVTGVDPSSEERLFAVLSPEQGQTLSAGNPSGIYLSQTHARDLRVKPGDVVTLTANSRDHQLNILTLTVAGIFKKSAPWYEYCAFVSLADAQEVLNLDHEAMEVNILLHRDDDLRSFVSDWKPRISSAMPRGRLETWHESAGFLASIVMSSMAGMAVVNLILLLVAATIVNNSITLTLSERTREIGTVKALGMTNARLLLLYASEYLVLAALAAVAGAAVGEALLLLGSRGIDITRYEALCWAFGGNTLRPEPSLSSFGIAVAVVTVFSLVTSLYPIRKATALSPVEALR